MPPFLSAAGTIDPLAMASLLPNTNADDCEIKPGIAEMIREEERVSTQRKSLILFIFFSRLFVLTSIFFIAAVGKIDENKKTITHLKWVVAQMCVRVCSCVHIQSYDFWTDLIEFEESLFILISSFIFYKKKKK